MKPGDRVVSRLGGRTVWVVADVRGSRLLVWPERVVSPDGYLPHEVPAVDFRLAGR